ncbi:MAG: glycosyltransferase, partial [Cetobacterium sp.]
TNVTGCKEIIEDKKNGYLVNVKDSIDLSEKIERFINLSNEERDEMGRNGRKKILNEFDEKIIIEIYRRKLWNLHL